MTSATRRLNVVTVGTASAVATVIAVLARAGVDVVDETMHLSAISPRVRP